jgi:hypothetical protein
VRRNSKQERERELADQAKLTRAWRKWHREQLEQALAGVHADVMNRLVAQLKDLRDARQFIDFISAQDWNLVHSDTRAVALHQINRAITALGESNGMPPFDDGVPGAPDNVLRLIRRIVAPDSRLSANISPEIFWQTRKQ